MNHTDIDDVLSQNHKASYIYHLLSGKWTSALVPQLLREALKGCANLGSPCVQRSTENLFADFVL